MAGIFTRIIFYEILFFFIQTSLKYVPNSIINKGQYWLR